MARPACFGVLRRDGDYFVFQADVFPMKPLHFRRADAREQHDACRRQTFPVVHVPGQAQQQGACLHGQGGNAAFLDDGDIHPCRWVAFRPTAAYGVGADRAESRPAIEKAARRAETAVEPFPAAGGIQPAHLPPGQIRPVPEQFARQSAQPF